MFQPIIRQEIEFLIAPPRFDTFFKRMRIIECTVFSAYSYLCVVAEKYFEVVTDISAIPRNDSRCMTFLLGVH